MSWQPGDYCEPVLHRRPSGWLRWWADCPCGWRFTGLGGKLAAQTAIERHLQPPICRCYDAQTMEYGPLCRCTIRERHR